MFDAPAKGDPMIIELRFDIVPKPQARPRARWFKGPDGKIKSGVYKAPAAAVAEGDLFCLAYNHPSRPAAPLAGPLAVEIAAYFPRPKSVKPDVVFVAKKPDIDNVIKFVLDVLTRAGYWLDDKQVVDTTATKMYVNRLQLTNVPSWHIKIREVGL
jgi:Holliday junction resolvase RusA-like endonuclease